MLMARSYFPDQQIQELRDQLRHHEHLYYVEDSPELTDAQYLRVYVRQLRQKIETDPERPQYILTETGIGYRLRAPE